MSREVSKEKGPKAPACKACKHFEFWGEDDILGDCRWHGPRPPHWVVESNLITIEDAPSKCPVFEPLQSWHGKAGKQTK